MSYNTLRLHPNFKISMLFTSLSNLHVPPLKVNVYISGFNRTTLSFTKSSTMNPDSGRVTAPVCSKSLSQSPIFRKRTKNRRCEYVDIPESPCEHSSINSCEIIHISHRLHPSANILFGISEFFLNILHVGFAIISGLVCIEGPGVGVESYDERYDFFRWCARWRRVCGDEP